MNSRITIRRRAGTWVARSQDAVLAETRDALELDRGHGDTQIFFPQKDVAMALLDASGTTKDPLGPVVQYSLRTPDSTLHNIAWAFDRPKDAMVPLAGYLAFTRAMTVEHV